MSTHKAASNLNELKIAIPTDRPWSRVASARAARLVARRPPSGRATSCHAGDQAKAKEADNSIWLASTVPAFVAKTNAERPDVCPVIEGDLTHRAALAIVEV